VAEVAKEVKEAKDANVAVAKVKGTIEKI